MERPIIFNGKMVRSILEGKKSQTRRVIKPQPNRIFWDIIVMNGYGGWRDEHGRPYPCPYGKEGDRLWVRETWRIVGWHEGMPYVIEYKADGTRLDEPGDSSDYDEDKYLQFWIDSSDDCDRANIPMDEDGIYQCKDHEIPTRWRPSIFMPRWASRIMLEITDVRVERLQDIQEKGFDAEGVSVDMFPKDTYLSWKKEVFMKYWDSLNSKRGYSWSANPWVWVISFVRK